MKYALLIYGDEGAWGQMSEEEMAKIYAGHEAYYKEMQAAGVHRGGSELQPTTTATSIRFQPGQAPRTTDGPFAETKEQLGGFYLIEVENLDQAIYWAEKMPCMREGTVEIRPLGLYD